VNQAVHCDYNSGTLSQTVHYIDDNAGTLNQALHYVDNAGTL